MVSFILENVLIYFASLSPRLPSVCRSGNATSSTVIAQFIQHFIRNTPYLFPRSFIIYVDKMSYQVFDIILTLPERRK